MWRARAPLIVLLGNNVFRPVTEVLRHFPGAAAKSSLLISPEPWPLDCVGVLLAAFGMLNPIFAALIHVTSELVFILNSARLLPAPGSAPKKEVHAHI